MRIPESRARRYGRERSYSYLVQPVKDGTFDYDEGWSFGRQLPVYLVAISLKQICRVPEEYLEKIESEDEHDG